MIKFQFTGKTLPLFCSVLERGLFWNTGLSRGANSEFPPSNSCWRGRAGAMEEGNRGPHQGAGQELGWIPAGKPVAGLTCSTAETRPGGRVRSRDRLGSRDIFGGVHWKFNLLGPVWAGWASDTLVSSGSHWETSCVKAHRPWSSSRAKPPSSSAHLVTTSAPRVLCSPPSTACCRSGGHSSGSSLTHHPHFTPPALFFRDCFIKAKTICSAGDTSKDGELKPRSSPASFLMRCWQVTSKSEIASDYLSTAKER